MTRSLGNLGIAALGVAALLGGLWAITRGQVAAGETGGLVSEGEPDPETPEDAPHLVGIQDPTEPLREAVSGAGDGVSATPEPGDVVELASVSGTLFLPSGFQPTEPIKVYAWPTGDDDRMPLEVEIAGSAKEWTFKELPVGPWVISARAVANDHCAWGKSKELKVAGSEEREGVEVPLKEFGVRGVVTDSGGAPLAGIEVRYDLDFSDRTVGDIAGWNQKKKSSWNNGPNQRIKINFGGENIAFANGLLRADAASDIRITSTLESGLSGAILAPPSIETIEMPTIDLGEYRIESNANQVAAQTALLEALTRQIEFDLTDSTVGSPNLNDPQFAAGLSSGAVQGWNFIHNTGEVEEAPSIPSSGVVITDAAGRFWVAVPGPGEVTMRVSDSELDLEANDPGYLGNSTSVDLTDDAPIGNAILALERAAAVTGRLVRADGQLDDISVFLRPFDGGTTDTSSTDGDGRFRFRGRKPGKYHFYARSGGDSGQDYCTCGVLQLSAGSIYLLDDVLTRSSSLTGVVVGKDGQPVAGAKVTAYGAANRSLTRTGRTDQWGVFTIVGMYPVDYTLEVSGRKVAEGMKFSVPPGGGMADSGTLTLEKAPELRRW